MSTAPRVVTFDWDAFHEHVQRLRVEHEERPNAEAVARSLEAFNRWGVAPPSSFYEQHPEAEHAARRGCPTSRREGSPTP